MDGVEAASQAWTHLQQENTEKRINTTQPETGYLLGLLVGDGTFSSTKATLCVWSPIAHTDKNIVEYKTLSKKTIYGA